QAPAVREAIGRDAAGEAAARGEARELHAAGHEDERGTLRRRAVAELALRGYTVTGRGAVADEAAHVIRSLRDRRDRRRRRSNRDRTAGNLRERRRDEAERPPAIHRAVCDAAEQVRRDTARQALELHAAQHRRGQ